MPSPEDGDRRHLHRELHTAKRDRTRIANRIQALLAVNQGVRVDWRKFRNQREVGALAGLMPTPYQSGESSGCQLKWPYRKCVAPAGLAASANETDIIDAVTKTMSLSNRCMRCLPSVLSPKSGLLSRLYVYWQAISIVSYVRS
jgi:hypothetical protein